MYQKEPDYQRGPLPWRAAWPHRAARPCRAASTIAAARNIAAAGTLAAALLATAAAMPAAAGTATAPIAAGTAPASQPGPRPSQPRPRPSQPGPRPSRYRSTPAHRPGRYGTASPPGRARRSCRSRWRCPAMDPHRRRRGHDLRHPHRRHLVVLGRQRKRPGRHRRPQLHRPGPPAADHHPSTGRLGQHHLPRCPHLRHPHRRHPVVLGLQQQRRTRHRHHTNRTARGRSPPRSDGWASVTAGELHTCATRTDGTLWCWG